MPKGNADKRFAVTARQLSCIDGKDRQNNEEPEHAQRKILASEKLEVLSCGVIWAAELAMRKLFGWAMVWASAAETDILVTCGGYSP